MDNVLRALLLVAATILTRVANANASPTPAFATPSLNTTSGAVNAQIHCDSAGRANTRHCLEAALQLPEWIMPGMFHDDDPLDEWYLPVTRIVEDCRVDVSIQGRDKEISSWPAIKHAASQMITICTVHHVVGGGTTAGHAFAGPSGEIKIHVSRITLGDLRGGDVTISMDVAREHTSS